MLIATNIGLIVLYTATIWVAVSSPEISPGGRGIREKAK